MKSFINIYFFFKLTLVSFLSYISQHLNNLSNNFIRIFASTIFFTSFRSNDLNNLPSFLFPFPFSKKKEEERQKKILYDVNNNLTYTHMYSVYLHILI